MLALLLDEDLVSLEVHGAHAREDLEALVHLFYLARCVGLPKMLLRLPFRVVEEHGFVLKTSVEPRPDEAGLAAQDAYDSLVVLDKCGLRLLRDLEGNEKCHHTGPPCASALPPLRSPGRRQADLKERLVNQGNAPIYRPIARRVRLRGLVGERSPEPLEMSFQPAELRDSPAKLWELLFNQGIQVRPGCTATALVGDFHQLPDLIKREVEEARLSDEPEPPEVLGREEPLTGRGVAMRGAFGGREQAGGLVESTLVRFTSPIS